MASCFKKSNFENMERNFSPLFQVADNISVTSQKKYMRLLVLNIFFLVLASFLAGISLYFESNLADGIKWVSALSTAVSIIITVIIFFTKYQMHWYEGRAVAESIKTLAWRYVTSSGFYSDSDEKDVDEKYLSDIKEILEERSEIASKINKTSLQGLQITPKMKEFREISLDEKKNIYLEQRIKKEINWYSNRSSRNRTAKVVWGILIVISQIFALLSAFFFSENADLSLNLTGFFATLAAGIISWTQTKQHQALSVSYSVAAQELRYIYEEGRKIEDNSKQFSDFVVDAEKAISREHTLWIARRVNPSYRKTI